MSRKRILFVFSGVVLLAAALASAFILMQASPEEILIESIETSKAITDGHAVVAFDIDSAERQSSGTAEVWARPAEEGPGAFRVVVLEATEAQAQGAVIVSNGATLWAYSPSKNQVLVGTPEEARALMEEGEFRGPEFGPLLDGSADKPETAEAAVERIQQYFDLENSGTESVAAETAYVLKLVPIPEQMPPEFNAMGGFFNLWIGQDSHLPLAGTYTGGSFGTLRATVLEFEVNTGVDDALFNFEVPAGAEVVAFADLKPQSLSVEEAGQNAEFAFLTPAETPSGATLVDILDVGGTLVQRYTLPEGGSFTIAQGIRSEAFAGSAPAGEGQPVEVRGAAGELFEDPESSKVLLVWSAGELFYSVAGDLSPDQALIIAESLQ